jgi:hypothetical protein
LLVTFKVRAALVEHLLHPSHGIHTWAFVAATIADGTLVGDDTDSVAGFNDLTVRHPRTYAWI